MTRKPEIGTDWYERYDFGSGRTLGTGCQYCGWEVKRGNGNAMAEMSHARRMVRQHIRDQHIDKLENEQAS